LKTFIIERSSAGLKSTWVYRIIDNTNSIIEKLYRKQLKQFGEELIFKCNMQTKDVKNSIFAVIV